MNFLQNSRRINDDYITTLVLLYNIWIKIISLIPSMKNVLKSFLLELLTELDFFCGNLVLNSVTILHK